jgi:hypothetical protein
VGDLITGVAYGVNGLIVHFTTIRGSIERPTLQKTHTKKKKEKKPHIVPPRAVRRPS